jgi:hypothetical protein
MLPLETKVDDRFVPVWTWFENNSKMNDEPHPLVVELFGVSCWFEILIILHLMDQRQPLIVNIRI